MTAPAPSTLCRALGMLGVLLGLACPGPSPQIVCRDDRSCPTGYFCALPEGLCHRRALPGDASAGDVTPGDASGQDHAALDSAGADLLTADAASTDSSLADASVDETGGLDRSPADVTTADSSGSDVLAGDAAGADLTGQDGGSPLPRIAGLQAVPASVIYGASTEIRFTPHDATQCTIDQVAVLINAGGQVQHSLAPSATRHIEVCCTGPGGQVCASVEVAVECTNPQPVNGPVIIHDAAELVELGNSVSGCWRVQGHLTIGPSASLFDLAPLRGLVEVTGTLDITDNADLSHLTGLEALHTVGGALYLGHYDNAQGVHLGNDSLQDVHALSGLRQIGGSLTVQLSPELGSLHGLEELQTLGGHLLVQHCNDLGDVRALHRLQSMGAYLWLEDLPRLTSLEGLQNVSQVGTDLGLVSLPQLTDLRALEFLHADLHSLYVTSCPLLQDLSGLQNLRISQWLQIRSNDGLVTLQGLPQTVSGVLTHVEIYDHPLLQSLDGLDSLVHVRLDPARVCTQARRTAKSCAGMLAIHDNASLPGLEGLNALTQVDDSLVIEDNARLQQVVALNAVLHIGGELSVQRNPQLISLDGLHQVGEIAAGVIIEDNDALLELAGLSGLAVLGGEVGQTPDLYSGGLVINGNLVLHDLGLRADCTFAGSLFQITNNAALPTATASALYSDWCEGTGLNCPFALIANNGP
ncbi:MAG: hypothetical protein ABIJ09_08975 [Pseudomonadota bacterium]